MGEIYKDIFIRLIVFLGAGYLGVVYFIKGLQKILDHFYKEE